MLNKKIVFYNSAGNSSFWKSYISCIENYGYITRVIQSDTKTIYYSSKLINSVIRRWKMYPGFFFKILMNIRAESDINIVTTNPFFAPLFVCLLSRKKSKTINLVYDLYPEALIQAGIIKENSVIASLIRFIFFKTLQKADVTVFLGERIKKYVEKKYSITTNALVIPVGADGTPFVEYSPKKLDRSDTLELIYSGNMGYCHESKTISQFLSLLDEPNLKVAFHSSGVEYEKFKTNTNPDFVFLGAPLMRLDWEKKMRESHVALISIKKGAENVVMPSKVYSSMLAGHAIIAICSKSSDLADLVRFYNCGWVVQNGDVDSLWVIVQELMSDPSVLQKKRENSFKAGHLFFEMSKIVPLWLPLISESDEKNYNLN